MHLAAGDHRGPAPVKKKSIFAVRTRHPRSEECLPSPGLPRSCGCPAANFTGLVLGCIEAKFCK